MVAGDLRLELHVRSEGFGSGAPATVNLLLRVIGPGTATSYASPGGSGCGARTGQLTGQTVANTVVPRLAACGDRFLPHRPVAGVPACP
jgi:hypothetical protein